MATSIPRHMRAARVSDFNKPYNVDSVNVPADLGSNDILVKIQAAGYCHTDLQVLQGVYASAGAKPGLIGSHEPVGVVVKMGSEAGKNGKVKNGDRVGSINVGAFVHVRTGNLILGARMPADTRRDENVDEHTY